MNLTERILELLKSNTMTVREVADALGANVGSVSGTIARLRYQGQVVVVSNKRKNNWTYRAGKDASIRTPLTQHIVDLLKTENLTAPEIAQKLRIEKASGVASSLTVRAKMGEVKVVGTKPSEKTGRMINVYGINPNYAKKVARTSKVSKELSKHFRVFKPTYGAPVMGVWV